MFLLSSGIGWADGSSDAQIESFLGEASVDNKLVYVEHHLVTYGPNGKLLKAVTDYVGPDGSKLAKIESDFSESLTVPTHLIENFQTGNREGIRRDGKKLILFDQDPGKPEKTLVLEENNADRILVGCQGLNYYLLGNLTSTMSKKKLPLRFLIPGKLDYYDFNLEFIKESSKDIFEFEVTVQNFFLKLFAPKLYIKYDGANKHLMTYKGLSNITDAKGNLQNVSIVYKYDSAKN